MSALAEGQQVVNPFGKRGNVHHMPVWGKRDPQPFVRFNGRLHYWRAGPMAWFVRAEAER